MTTRTAILASTLFLVCSANVLAAVEDRVAPPPGVEADWWSTVQRSLAEREYHARRADSRSGEAVLQAPNRAQNLRTHFLPDGVELMPREDGAAKWRFGMTLVGIGRGAEVVRPKPAMRVENGNRVEYRRGDVVEWYVNEPRGLEQGFTLSKRPDGVDGEPLRLIIELKGGLHPRRSHDGLEVGFALASGAEVLRLSKLVTWDAEGTILDSRFELSAARMSLVVDDSNARYPLTIDPLATTPDWKVIGEQVESDFGFDADSAGDVNGDGYSDMIIGAPRWDDGSKADVGAAFVYLGSSQGLSSLPAWTAIGTKALPRLGYRSAAAGDVNGDGFSDVLVAGYDDVNLYMGSASGLESAPAWIKVSEDGFLLVAAAGDVDADGFGDVLVYFNVDDTFRLYRGSASGLKSNESWTRVVPQNGFGPNSFEMSAGAAGDVNGNGFTDLIVGDPLHDSHRGRVLAFHGSASGPKDNPQWTEKGPAGVGVFGDTVVGAGDVDCDGYADVMISAPYHSGNGIQSGKVFLYRGSDTGLLASPTWTRDGAGSGKNLGRHVATAGDVNGDGYADILLSQTNPRRAFLHLGGPAGPAIEHVWNADGVAANGFGNRVGSSGDVNGDGFSDIFVNSGIASGTFKGFVSVYHGGPSGPAEFAGLALSGGQADARLGFAIAALGDVNGDHVDDIAVGAHRYDGGEVEEGRVEVYLGVEGSGPSATPAWTAEGDQAGANFGAALAGVHDVNGDGYSDLLVSARNYDAGETDEGRVSLFLGGASGLGVAASWTAESDQASAGYGWSVAGAGDVNGDGFADLLVGCRYYDGDKNKEGRVDAFLGGPAGPSATPDWSVEGNQVDAQMGRSVAGAGDVNGDGYSDVIIGVHSWDGDQSNEGQARVYHGAEGGLDSVAAWSVEGDQADAEEGFSVAGAGDVNGDGYADVIVGARRFDGGEIDEGRARVFRGSANGLAATPSWSVESDQAGAELGYAVASGGDVNGDGYSDVLLGVRLFDGAVADEGRAQLHFGSAAGLSVDPDWTAAGAQPDDRFGVSVAAGDVNADGYSDVLIGISHSDTGSVDGGAFQIYFGNGGAGRAVLPRQRAVDDSPIAVLGLTSGGKVKLSVRGRSVLDLSRMRIEVEVKPLGVPFDGLGTEFGLWTDLSLSEDVSKTITLPAVGPHHWRARVHYDSVSPIQPKWGKWISPHGNGSEEADLRNDAVCIGVEALAAPYGAGKGGTLGVPTLSSAAPPTLGGVADLTIGNALPGAGPVLLFVGFTPATLPFDGGTLLTNPVFTINLPPIPAGGSLAIPFALPPSTQWCGLQIYLQAIFVDPGASGFYQTAQTNGLQWTLGS